MSSASVQSIVGLALVEAARAAERLGVLRALERRVGVEELAEQLGLSERALELVLGLLCAAGYVDRTASGFHRTADTMGERLDELEDFLRTGNVPDSIDRPAMRGPYYAEGARRLGNAVAEVATSLAEQLRPVGRIADVGAGSGVWSLAMAARCDARVIAVDLPDVLPNVWATAARLGLTDRVTTVASDYFEAVLDAPADRIVLANVLHLEDEPDAARLVRHWTKQLAPDGELVIVDVFAPANPQAELEVAAYDLHLGMRTRRGAAHREARLRQWCVDAGLGPQQLIRLGVVSLSALVCRRAAQVGPQVIDTSVGD